MLIPQLFNPQAHTPPPLLFPLASLGKGVGLHLPLPSPFPSQNLHAATVTRLWVSECLPPVKNKDIIFFIYKKRRKKFPHKSTTMITPFGKKCNKCLHRSVGTNSQATWYYGTQEASTVMLAHQA